VILSILCSLAIMWCNPVPLFFFVGEHLRSRHARKVVCSLFDVHVFLSCCVRVPPDVITCNSLISSCEQGKQPKEPWSCRWQCSGKVWCPMY